MHFLTFRMHYKRSFICHWMAIVTLHFRRRIQILFFCISHQWLSFTFNSRFLCAFSFVEAHLVIDEIVCARKAFKIDAKFAAHRKDKTLHRHFNKQRRRRLCENHAQKAAELCAAATDWSKIALAPRAVWILKELREINMSSSRERTAPSPTACHPPTHPPPLIRVDYITRAKQRMFGVRRGFCGWFRPMRGALG